MPTVDVQGIMNDPRIPASEKQMAIKRAYEIAGVPMPSSTPPPSRLAPAPAPTPTPWHAASDPPETPLDVGPHFNDLGFPMSPLAPYTQGLEKGMDLAKQGLQTAADTVLGTTGGQAAKPVIGMFPSNVPEVVGDASMIMMPELGGLRGVVAKVLGPPAMAMLTSQGLGSRVGPLRTGITTGIGSLGGEVIHAGQTLALGGAGSNRIFDILQQDQINVGQTLQQEFPDLVPLRGLSKPSEVLDWFGQDARQIPAIAQETAQGKSLMQQYEHLTPAKDAMLARADALNARVANMPPALRAYHLRALQSQINNLRMSANRIEQMRVQAEALQDSAEQKSTQFDLLKSFFGKKRSFMAGYEGKPGKDLVLDSGAWQDFVSDTDNVTTLRNAGTPDSSIHNLKRQAYRQPNATPQNIVSQTDVAPKPFAPGIRLHYYHATPRPIMHFDMPTAARMSGTAQAQLTPNKIWKSIGGPLMARIGYGIGDYGEDEPATAENTRSPSPATGSVR